MPKRELLAGTTLSSGVFIIADLPPDKHRHARCLAKCPRCGKEFEALAPKLKSGHTRSCGCLHDSLIAERSFKHGHAKRGKLTRTYESYRNMLQRCLNENNPQFPGYGGRDRIVCEGLANFPGFFSVLGECPPKLTIDRINNEGSYTCGKCPTCLANGWPMNVHWATQKQQQRNKRNNVKYTVRGVTGCVPELCEHFHLVANRVYRRLWLGWSIENAMFTEKLR